MVKAGPSRARTRPRPQPSRPRLDLRGQGQDQGLNPQGQGWTFEAKAIGPMAKAFMYKARAEIKIRSTSNNPTRLLMNCFCLGIHSII